MPKKLPSSMLARQAGLRLRAAREVIGLTQEQLAKQLGIGRTALANWEGGRLPDVRAMVRLLSDFGISLEWIYAGSLARVPYDDARALEAAAAELGAVVGGPVAEWPSAVRQRDALLPAARQPAQAPAATRRSRTLHERPEPLTGSDR